MSTSSSFGAGSDEPPLPYSLYDSPYETHSNVPPPPYKLLQQTQSFARFRIATSGQTQASPYLSHNPPFNDAADHTEECIWCYGNAILHLKAGLNSEHIGFLEAKLNGIEADRHLSRKQIIITKNHAAELKNVGPIAYKRDLGKIRFELFWWMDPGRGRGIEYDLEKIRDEFFGKDSKEGANLGKLESKIKTMKGFLVDVENRAAAMGQKIEARATGHLAAKQEHEMVVRELGEEEGSLEEMRCRVNAVWRKARLIKKGTDAQGLCGSRCPVNSRGLRDVRTYAQALLGRAVLA